MVIIIIIIRDGPLLLHLYYYCLTILCLSNLDVPYLPFIFFRYNDFVELLRRTRSAFCMAPGGMARFNDILDMIRKSYPKKGELWQKIMTGLSTA